MKFMLAIFKNPTARYIAKRLLLAIPVSFGVLVMVFLLMHMVPGDPVEVMLGESAPAADRVALREALHLNEPLHTQFKYFIKELINGDLESVFYHRPVMDEIFFQTCEYRPIGYCSAYYIIADFFSSGNHIRSQKRKSGR